MMEKLRSWPGRSLFWFSLWGLCALALLWPVSHWLRGSFPILTLFWISIPLAAAWRVRDAGRVGFRRVGWRLLLGTTAVNLGGLLALMLAFEPWSHTYQALVSLALDSPTPDTTFAWLLRLPRLPALAGMTLYSGLVTMFGEELFFRGWLLQALQKRTGALLAVVVQAMLFVLPNLLVAFFLPGWQAVLYAGVYTFVGIGLLGGWAAWRTGSIWPSLVSAVVCNLVLVALVA